MASGDAAELNGSSHDTVVDNSFPSSSNDEILSQGAEARLYRTVYLGKDAVMKERFSKKYRHPVLDKRLTKERIRNEMRAIVKCQQSGVEVPAVYFFNTQTNAIIFEFIPGPTVKAYIENCRHNVETAEFEVQMRALGHQLGCAVGRVHAAGLTHGDLTTSNMILRNADPQRPCLIDFGLSNNKNTPEDFGVDLYVLERAIRSTHVEIEFLFEEILKGYSEAAGKSAPAVIKKLDEVRQRGRKREMVG